MREGGGENGERFFRIFCRQQRATQEAPFLLYQKKEKVGAIAVGDRRQGMVKLGMPARPNKKGGRYTVHLSTLNNILITRGQIGLSS